VEGGLVTVNLEKLPFGPTKPNPYRDVESLIDVDENVYEAQARLLDDERNYSASCLDVAHLRAGRSYDKGEISREERDHIQARLRSMRARVLIAHTGEEWLHRKYWNESAPSCFFPSFSKYSPSSLRYFSILSKSLLIQVAPLF